MNTDDLEARDALPEALRVLVRELPRSGWEAHPNFDGLTRFWLDRHLMFRQMLDHLQSETRACLDGDRAPRDHARLTARLGGAFLNELHGHHMIEDAHYFPVLSDLDPRLSAGFELLDRDHKALDGHLHALAASANSFLQEAEGFAARDRAADLLTALDAFAPFLNRHLEDEEELVVPVILAHAPTL